jgi:hypothetical protein
MFVCELVLLLGDWMAASLRLSHAAWTSRAKIRVFKLPASYLILRGRYIHCNNLAPTDLQHDILLAIASGLTNSHSEIAHNAPHHLR